MKIAAIQTDVKLGATDENLSMMEGHLRSLAEQNVELVIFPECALTGYCFNSAEEAREYAETVPGPTCEKLAAICRETGQYTIFGMLESAGDELFNAAVLVGPDGVGGHYRKTHLPYLGIDRFTDFGREPYVVFQAGDLRIGMLICYDASFPEASRALALAGADLVALPTNWPPGAEQVAEYTINSRAMENGIYFAAVNRVGDERGFTFIGKSRISDPNGVTMDSADHRKEAILIADIEPAAAREKLIVRVPDQHIIHRLADRRPELYSALSEPHNLPRPGRDA